MKFHLLNTLLLTLGIISLFVLNFPINESKSYRPTFGKAHPLSPAKSDTLPDIIRDSGTAIKIGIVILGTIYGHQYIKNCKPYHAELINNSDTWKVKASIHKKFTTGGEPIILVHKKDARVINYYHTR